MPADLDRMFAALRADADALPLTEPAAPRRRGERLRRTRVGLSAIATACLVVAVTAGGAWLGRGQERPEPARPPMPPVGHPVDFTPLKQVGPGLTFDAPTRLGQSASVGDRAFVGWQQQDGLLKVAALDMDTGRPAWPARSLGPSDDWNGLIALPQAVIMIAGHNDGRPLDQTLFVLDPATGQVRWERGLHMDGDELVFFDAAMVIAGSGGQTTALDWRNGAELWSIPAGADPPVRSFGMRLPADLGGPGAPDGYGFALTHSDGRLLQLTRAGNLLVSDVRTGRKLAEPRRVAAPTRADGQTDGVLAYDGRLFLASSTETPYRVRMTELTTASKAQVIYTAPVADRTFAFMAPCGGGGRRICLTETGGDPASVDVVAVDLATRAPVWRVSAPFPVALAPAGDRLLVATLPGGPTLLDANGKRLLESAHGARTDGTWAAGGWVTTGSLLLMEGGAGTAEVFGVSATDGHRTSLGRVPALQPIGCSWNERTLVCPTAEGFGVWRFAAG